MEKTACLIVDVQQSVVSALPDGGEELTEKLSRLITWCRQQMVPLVYVRHDDGEDRISEILPGSILPSVDHFHGSCSDRMAVDLQSGLWPFELFSVSVRD